jgi:sugar (pentulose or hexulose) kinase
MTDRVIIAIDIGSSSIRCSAYTELNIIASSSRTTSSVEVISGKINIQSTNAIGKTLLDQVEDCLDETLGKLQHMDDTVQVVAVGFACFVMNLVGINRSGNIIGSEATMSYACSSDEVANEVDCLKR